MQYNYRNSQQSNEAQQQQIAQKPQQSSPSLDMKNVINRIKFVWDIFVAMNSAWNSVAQQQTKYIKEERFNTTVKGTKGSNSSMSLQAIDDSNLPTNFQNSAMKNSKGKSTLAPESRVKSSTTRTSITTPLPAIEVGEQDSEDEDEQENSSDRKRRDADESSAVGEARYIKGDPLKGYYDFVITEGSYKFWAAFQVMLIFSTYVELCFVLLYRILEDTICHCFKNFE